MSIIRFNPLLSRSWIRSFWPEEEEWPEFTLTEGLDVYEEDDKVVVKTAVPGISADKVDITYEDGVLHIKAKAEEKEEEKKKIKTIYRMERVASFNYTTTIPRPIGVVTYPSLAIIT